MIGSDMAALRSKTIAGPRIETHQRKEKGRKTEVSEIEHILPPIGTIRAFLAEKRAKAQFGFGRGA
jgi:hypothetical protein